MQELTPFSDATGADGASGGGSRDRGTEGVGVSDVDSDSSPLSSVRCRDTWTCQQCTSENSLELSTCSLCAARRPTPPGITGAVAVGSVMLLCSVLLTFSLQGPLHGPQDVRQFLIADAHSIENVGHCGLIVIFAGMYWLSGKLYCWYMLHLSASFMTLVGGISLTALSMAISQPHNRGGVGIAAFIVSLIFSLGCLTCVWSLFYDMDGKRNFSLRDSRRMFPTALLDDKQNNPQNDTPAITFWSRRLHVCLLCQVGFLAVTVLVRGVACALDISRQQDATLIVEALSASVWSASFVESYTMVFHRCFILSTGFAGMMRLDDTLEMFGHGTLVFLCFAAVRAVRGFMIVASSSLPKTSSLPSWWGLHIEPCANLIIQLISLFVAYNLRQAAQMNCDIRVRPQSARDRTRRLPRATIFNLGSARARFVALSATFLALTWQGQALYMMLNEIKSETVDLEPEAMLPVFNSAVNFSMHGAAFYLFHTCLSFQSRSGYLRLREIHILAGFFAGAYSFALLVHIYVFRCSRTLHPYDDLSVCEIRRALSLMILLAVRGVACWSYGFAFFLYKPQDLDSDLDEYDLRIRLAAESRDDAKQQYAAVSLDAEQVESEGEGTNVPGGGICHLELKQQTESKVEDMTAILRSAERFGSPCPADVARAIDKRGKYGRAAVIFAGCVWSVYVIFLNVSLPKQSSESGSAKTAVAVHPLGFGITFHVVYLMTLFSWHGFFTGNLVTLDVGRNFALSTLGLALLLSFIVSRVTWLGLLMGFASLMVVLHSLCFSRISAQWSPDPLKTWRR